MIFYYCFFYGFLVDFQETQNGRKKLYIKTDLLFKINFDFLRRPLFPQNPISWKCHVLHVCTHHAHVCMYTCTHALCMYVLHVHVQHDYCYWHHASSGCTGHRYSMSSGLMTDSVYSVLHSTVTTWSMYMYTHSTYIVLHVHVHTCMCSTCTYIWH